MSKKLSKLLGKTKAEKIIARLKPAGGFSKKETKKIEEDIHESLKRTLRRINSRPSDFPRRKVY